MIDLNLINHITNSVTEACEDNNLQFWKDNVEISYGSIIINDIEYMYIKIKETASYKETLLDISMPWSCYRVCKMEVKQSLIDLLMQS